MLAATTSRPKIITIILVLLLIMAVVSTASAVSTRLGSGGNRGNRSAGGTGQGTGNFQGNNNSGGNFQGNNAAGQTDNGGGTGTTQRRNTQTGFNLFSMTRSLGINPQVMVYVSMGFTILGILLVLLSAYGIWKQKIWGLNLATLMAVIFLIGAVPALFTSSGRFINWLRIGENVLSTLAALPILGLSFLPSVRDYFPKQKAKPKVSAHG